MSEVQIELVVHILATNPLLKRLQVLQRAFDSTDLDLYLPSYIRDLQMRESTGERQPQPCRGVRCRHVDLQAWSATSIQPVKAGYRSCCSHPRSTTAALSWSSGRQASFPCKCRCLSGARTGMPTRSVL